MASQPLSPETEKRVVLLFAPELQEAVRAILVEECGNNLPFLHDFDEIRLERFRFAALKLSGGSIDKLKSAVALAKEDWRDLLVAAEFAKDVHAHKSWLPGSPKTK